jgi:cellulose synthase/poly-beta-1,6-N-acetylglucosamine synthase-like glycosyltransferase
MEKVFISIVIPARNAGDIIEKCLKSIIQLDYPQEKIEIIVADGLSSDHTAEISRKYNAKVINNHGKTVVAARNIGFKAAHGELIAFTDADCEVDKNWLNNCLKYFDDENVAGIGGPNLIPIDERPFGKAVGLIFEYAYKFRAGAPTKVYSKPIESRSHGSNAIYRASILGKVLPIEETTVAGEDVLMNEAIKKLHFKLLYVPDVIVYHHRRTTAHSWWRQMRWYGAGRVLLSRKTRGMINLPYLFAGIFIPLFLLLCLITLLVNFRLFEILILIVIIILFLSMLLSYFRVKSIIVSANTPLVIIIGLSAWSYGYVQELLFKNVLIPSNNKNDSKF